MSTYNSVPTYWVHIYMAGDLQQAKQVCREFCAKGLCVTIEALDYIYTGGEEAGFRVGLIKYARFPKTNGEISDTAIDLAEALRIRLCQHSYSVVTPTKTVWYSTREGN